MSANHSNSNEDDLEENGLFNGCGMAEALCQRKSL
jgi:hypothetical protein